ncbi:inter-alpha-trypsin inhibitor heavy chain H3-like [Nematolebias whitei]|uniref:inter-alpha-trypsin inhibitor heavy chain H3-like n=1 Tax=Nematolebias whitei TaxID=451745 RepID=UPI00189AA47D|nr:inter-alpha-trypsin inhibitor heavy chain H3-like [Nematolebias whitei]
MGRAVLQLTFYGLLMALSASQPNKGDWDIYSFHINSTVTGRYATTIITSRVANRMEESKEIEFHVQIPKNAFISKFRMFIDGQVYDGVVKSKEQAQQQYTEAVSRGESAGIVSSVGRTMEEFKTSVTVAAHEKVTFELTYEELLKRTLGKYELLIHARPMQPVKDFKVDVYVYENAGISFIDVKGGLSTKALANAITKTHAANKAWVYFYPTVDQQKICDSCGEQGMNGDLVIVYDVNRDAALGDIKTSDGYFVHHFAPSNLPRIPKNIVFIIDRSSSMEGRKMKQTRIALIHILNDLAEDDFFSVLTFDSQISHWKRKLVQATSVNLEGAKEFAKTIRSRRTTNINAAVLDGARMLNEHLREGSASILILLTDGDPTAGVTNFEVIQSNVRRAIAGKFPLYCLGFGFDVKFEFLEKMSLENNGVARRIYEDSDADLQLTGFYEEVATPLLTDVTMIYMGGTNLTQTNFSQYYNGSEIVVAGEIIDNDIETFSPQVVAISNSRKMKFSDSSTPVEPSAETVTEGLLQRVWAYLTVKQLLDKELLFSGLEKENVRKVVLELSLKYNFVTPLTSMVVTKPEGENTQVLHKPKEGEAEGSRARASSGQHLLSGSSQKHGGVHQQANSDPDLTYRLTRPSLHNHPGPHIGKDHPGPPGDGWYGSDFSLHSPVLEDSVPSHGNAYFDSFDDDSVPVMATSAPVSHRLLLKAENQSQPLCFDVTGAAILKLFHHPSREVYMNGELDSVTNGGFKMIVVHVGCDQHVEVDTEGVTLRDGQSTTRHTGLDPITAGSVTVIKRDKEIDVAAEDVRVIILVHEKNGEKFLWPVLRQRPSASNTEGVLALKTEYEVKRGRRKATLQIGNHVIKASSSFADDYSISPTMASPCWLVSPDQALQRPLQDFCTAQI